jgi:hypothetical protein
MVPVPALLWEVRGGKRAYCTTPGSSFRFALLLVSCFRHVMYDRYLPISVSIVQFKYCMYRSYVLELVVRPG